ncbi:unnamed protein product [Phytophthora lilii]|uniref:Unnamed protein product n=1 Tax=Phytophthora lilii TaxID=2077276 RepID=A0A9W6TS23_9STRA|nr:unnamed protein product [Phytophthora lilii]
MSSTCFPDPAAGEDGWLTPSSGAIVNIAPARDDAVVEPLMKSLATKLHPRNVQVNAILLPPRPTTDATDEVPEDTSALSYSILFLLSPMSRLLSGSVLRLQQDKSQAVSASADRRPEEVPPTTSETVAFGELRCGMSGEGSVFSVDIEHNAEVEALQEVIVNKKKNASGRLKVIEVVDLAARKLLLGCLPETRSYNGATMFGVASMLCRLGVRPKSSSVLAPRAIADSMAILAYVNVERDGFVACYASDPILTLGAITVWYAQRDALQTYILPEFSKLLLKEALESGVLGSSRTDRYSHSAICSTSNTPRFDFQNNQQSPMRLSCVVLVAAAMASFLASGNATVATSDRSTKVSKMASPDATVLLPADPSGEKRALRYQHDEEEDDKESDDNEERGDVLEASQLEEMAKLAEGAKAYDLPEELKNPFLDMHKLGLNNYNMEGEIMKPEYDDLRRLYRSWLYHYAPKKSE